MTLALLPQHGGGTEGETVAAKPGGAAWRDADIRVTPAAAAALPTHASREQRVDVS